MADTTKNYSDLDAFLANAGYAEPTPAPAAKAKAKGKGPTAQQVLDNQAGTYELNQTKQAAQDAAARLQTALAQYKEGALTKDQLNNIFGDYTKIQDKLQTIDAPSAQAINAQYFPGRGSAAPKTNNAEGSIAPTLVFGPDGKPEKNPDGTYKTQIVDENGNVNGVAPTIVFDKNGKPVKNPDGSYKTQVADENGNVNGVAPTIVFGPDGKPVKNPDGSYKTAVGATAPNATPPANNTPGSSGGSKSTGNTPTGASGFTPLTQTEQDANAFKLAGPNISQDAKSQLWSQQYGGIGAMALTIPWMKNLLAQAASGGWSATKFTNEVKNYTDSSGQKPWDTLAQAYRDSTLAYYDNKQAWAQQYNDKLDILQKSAIAQGLDPSVFGSALSIKDPSHLSPDEIKAIDAAYQDQHSGVNSFFNVYYNNMPDQATIDKYVSNHTSLAKTDNGVYGGVIGQHVNTLTDYAESMGISPMLLPAQQGGASDYYANAAKAIQNGTTTMEEQQNYIKQQAIATYAPFANRIKEGMTVQSLASPYINAASNLLEIAPSKIALSDTQGLGQFVTTALQGDGTNPMSLDKFMTAVKQRPEWLQTTNARNSVMDTATTFLRNMGMVTGG